MKYSEILEACWKSYRQAGMKKKGDRMVPNCVPVEENQTNPERNTAKSLARDLNSWIKDYQEIQAAGLDSSNINYIRKLKRNIETAHEQIRRLGYRFDAANPDLVRLMGKPLQEYTGDPFVDNAAKELLGMIIMFGTPFAIGAYLNIRNKLDKYRGSQIINALERKGVTMNRETYEKVKPVLDRFDQAIRDNEGAEAKALAKRIEQMIVMGKLSAPEPNPADSALAAKERELEEDLKKWFKEKWVRFGPDGKIRGDCARGSDKEGKPKCLPQAKAHALGKKGRAAAAAKKRREDPNPERRGPARNVATKVKEQGVAEMDKSQTPPARHGDYPVGAKGTTAKPVSAKKVVKDLARDLDKAFAKEKKVREATGDPRFDKMMGRIVDPVAALKQDRVYEEQLEDYVFEFMNEFLTRMDRLGIEVWRDNPRAGEDLTNPKFEQAYEQASLKAVQKFMQSKKLDTNNQRLVAQVKADFNENADQIPEVAGFLGAFMQGFTTLRPGEIDIMSKVGMFKKPGQDMDEAQTDYQKRRQRERDVDMGRPVKPLPKNPRTDYQKRREQQRREQDLGEEAVAEGFEYGSRVQHPKYGAGQVIQVYSNGVITVNFPNYPDPIDKKPGVRSNFAPGDKDYQSLKPIAEAEAKTYYRVIFNGRPIDMLFATMQQAQMVAAKLEQKHGGQARVDHTVDSSKSLSKFELDEIDRRGFLKGLGATAGLAAMGGAKAVTSPDDPSWRKVGQPFDSSVTSSQQVKQTPGQQSTVTSRIADVKGPNAKGEYLVTVIHDDDIVSNYVTKTPPKSWMHGKHQAYLEQQELDEKQDACYRKVKSRYKVWPSAYASGALVQCRKRGAANWGNKGKK